MAYFLPSYFQKRLLRYALTRLDLIETDALNLEDLDISFGQRSVIELKNVGIKVAKLIEKLHLPPNISLKHALIRRLQVTVPADLHVSGIVVVVDGIDVHVEVQEQDGEGYHANTSRSGDGAVKRRSTTSERLDTDTGSASVLPTSEDLAKSFLEAEPRQERQELEAVLQSQSQHMTESVSSVEDSGLGLPGGFSLPAFVANFFAGIADRLSVEIKNIEVTAGLQLPSEGSAIEKVRLMIRLAQISLHSLSRSTAANDSPLPRRRIEIAGFELLLLSEAEAFAQHSTTSSPRLSRSRSKMSSAPGSDNFGQFESPLHTSFAQSRQASEGIESELDLDFRATASSLSSSLGSAHRNVSQDGILLQDSQMLDRTPGARPEFNDLQSVDELDFRDNRRNAERVLTTHETGVPFRSMTEYRGSEAEDLAESRMFTHDEAESMYMSAVSNTTGMPGGWAQDAEEPTSARPFHLEQKPKPLSSVSEQAIRTISESTGLRNPSFDTSEHDSYQSSTDPTADFSNLVIKRLISIDRCSLTIPESKSDSEPDTQIIPQEALPISADPAASFKKGSNLRVSSRQPLHSSNSAMRSSVLTQSAYGHAENRGSTMQLDFEHSFQAETIACHLDLSICRILVRMASAAKKMLSSPSTGATEETSLGQLSLCIKVKDISLGVYPSVPHAMLPSQPDLNRDKAQTHICLLRLSLLNSQYECTRQSDNLRQKLVIEKIEVGQASEKFLYFVDSVNVRESMIASTVIRPNDLVITNLNDRYDIQLKAIHIVTDLLRVDDVLSRGGGLDSLIDLGNSVMSTGTVRDPQPPIVGSRVRHQRTVRFDRPSSTAEPDIETSSSGLKIDVRIAGAFLELIGSETSLHLRTSAIKVASRKSAIQARIDSASLTGPLLHGSRSSADINTKLSNLSLVFSTEPSEDDLDRLLSLLTPSNDKYGDEDDIMVETLIRQRRKGSVARLETGDIQINVRGVRWHQHVVKLADEISRLSAVSKYLPEDDRPGLLVFALVRKLALRLDLGKPFGILSVGAALLEGAQISVPSLLAAQISNLSVRRGESDLLLHEVIPNSQDSVLMGPPMLMCRFIADEMEPTVRFKLSNTQLEYHVDTLVAVLDLIKVLPRDLSTGDDVCSPLSSQSSSQPSETVELARTVKISLAIRNSAIGLNPNKNPAKALIVLSDASIAYDTARDTSRVQADLRKASILIVNDIDTIGHDATNADHKLYFEENDQIQELTRAGFVPVGSIFKATAVVDISKDKTSGTSMLDVELRNKLFLLETCADSTQTLIQVFSGLSPPSVPSTIAKYRTEIVPIQDMLASFTGNAFVSEPGPQLGLQASHSTSVTRSSHHEDEYHEDDQDEDDSDAEDEEEEEEDEEEDDDNNDEEDEEDEYPDDDTYHRNYEDNDSMRESFTDSDMSQSIMSGSVHVAPVNTTAQDPGLSESIMAHSMLDFRNEHFLQKPSIEGTAHRWDSSRNTYELGSEITLSKSPVKARVRDVHIIWNLFDGYDWQTTRDTISNAVQEIENKAASRQNRRDKRESLSAEEDESVIGDFLFNSIYIGIPASRDFKDLASAINHDLGDAASETGSYATRTTVTATPTNPVGAGRSRRQLKLSRSRQHKMTFELQGVSADLLAFPPGSGEVESSIDVRIKTLEVFDHVPTSTWKKFATYMREAGEKEVDTSMIHLELLNVKPIAELTASEMVAKLTVLPLRLHIDQDALDFMTRFFEFKEESQPSSSDAATAPLFLQRVEVNPIRLKLDFKPKRVDYASLRSGRTTEFMNFFVLDRAEMVLRRVILYGVSGLERLGIMLNNIWSPDVKRNQLPGVLAGLAPFRPFVDVTSGVRDLISVPIREYKKDGRIVRSIQKGALAFAKTTTTELVNLGAKLAIGTQTVLQNAEDMLTTREQDKNAEVREQISLYADQPLGIVQGLRGAYASLERDLLLAKDAIVAVPGEVMASGSAKGAAAAVLRQSPTIILRPAIGASKAVGQTLLGAGNTLDKGNIRRIEQKYKRH